MSSATRSTGATSSGGCAAPAPTPPPPPSAPPPATARNRLRGLEAARREDRLTLNKGAFFDVWGRNLEVQEAR